MTYLASVIGQLIGEKKSVQVGTVFVKTFLFLPLNMPTLTHRGRTENLETSIWLKIYFLNHAPNNS